MLPLSHTCAWAMSPMVGTMLDTSHAMPHHIPYHASCYATCMPSSGLLKDLGPTGQPCLTWVDKRWVPRVQRSRLWGPGLKWACHFMDPVIDDPSHPVGGWVLPSVSTKYVLRCFHLSAIHRPHSTDPYHGPRPISSIQGPSQKYCFPNNRPLPLHPQTLLLRSQQERTPRDPRSMSSTF